MYGKASSGEWYSARKPGPLEGYVVSEPVAPGNQGLVIAPAMGKRGGEAVGDGCRRRGWIVEQVDDGTAEIGDGEIGAASTTPGFQTAATAVRPRCRPALSASAVRNRYLYVFL